MSSIVELLYNRYIRKYSKIFFIIVIAALFIYIGHYGYKKFYLEKQAAKDFSDVANANTRKKIAEVYFFFAEWCPHCKTAKPEWVQFKEEYDKKVVNDYEISCIEIDCTNENNQDSSILISKYKIEGYPTILMMVNNNRIDYDAKVTKSGLEQLVISATN